MSDSDASQPGTPQRPEASWLSRSMLRPRVEWGAMSNVGHVRSVNEDCYFVGRYDRTLEPVLTNLDVTSEVAWHHRAGHVALVADGMGGDAAGELASRLAVTTFLGLALDTPDWIMRYDDPSLVAEVIERVEHRLRRVDEVLASVGRTRTTHSGLGTTLTIMGLLPPDGLVAHIGDSRAYLYRAGRLTQLTRDHTSARSLSDAGLADARGESGHPLRQVLTDALGHEQGRLGIEVHQLRFEPGDRVLLCTDGLTDSLCDDHIAGLLETVPSPALACKALLETALEHGGADNITIVIGRL